MSTEARDGRSPAPTGAEMLTPPEIRAKFSGPPTEDDVTISLDGRPISTREQMLEFLAEIDALHTAATREGRKP